MRAWLIFLGGVVAAWLSVWALAHVLHESWSALLAVLYGVIVGAGGLGARWIRKYREHASRSAKEGSVEQEIALRAAAGTFGAAFVAMVVFGLYLVVQDQFLQAFVLYLLIVSVVATFWVRYAIIRNRLT